MSLPAARARRLLAVLDLTSLGEADSAQSVRQLCDEALASVTRPAAVCVWPEFVVAARERLEAGGGAGTPVATVVNFPDGGNDPDRAARETRRAVCAGAAEIDVVFPWRAYVGGDRDGGRLLLEACRAECGRRPLKAILEAGELRDPLLIRDVALAALSAGADFVKTSTGKLRSGATPESARAMLQAVREHGRGGFKASGGIRDVAAADRYLGLAEETMGEGWADAAHFRIGASTLLVPLRKAAGEATGGR